MALYAFDGTWNAAKDGDDQDPKNTNVARFFRRYHRHSGTDDFYVAGVGTRFDTIGKILGGAFGLGVLPRINEAYEHLCKVWPTDKIIDIVGFSRGAATTLDFCHVIQERGIRRPGSDEVIEANPAIRFLGLWDVVAAFGLANLGNTALNIGHHLSLPKSQLQVLLSCDGPRRAAAIVPADPAERRKRSLVPRRAFRCGWRQRQQRPERHHAALDAEEGQSGVAADHR